MGLEAYFEQEMPVFQSRIITSYVQHRHMQDTVMKHET